jgi:outer membrane immunogenic protein
MVDPAYNWSGFYIGVNAGGGWLRDQFSDIPPATNLGVTPASRKSGFVGGGQAGVNWQVSQFVFGIEGDIDSASINAIVGCAGGPPAICSTKQDYLASVRGRAGIAFNNILLYGTGGVAFTNYNHSTAFTGFALGPINWSSDSRTGWVAGLGAEYAFTSNWILGAEWKHYDFGNRTLTTASPGFVGIQQNFRETEDTIVARLSYKFGWSGPVVGRY